MAMSVEERALAEACRRAREYAERHGDPHGAVWSLQNRLRVLRRGERLAAKAEPAPDPAPTDRAPKTAKTLAAKMRGRKRAR